MYETYFGLKKRPFRALASGNDVFVGPQTATTMAGLKKALSNPDAIAAVSGPIGSGKTTIVNRAVNAVGDKRLIVTLGRIHLGHDEVLELLLDEMGADPIPVGTVQRFTKFRRLLQEQANKDTRVIVVVEDAPRIGVEALAELEALTATDAGVSDGANIVLMGEQIEALLDAPELSRLKQRLRLRMSVQPLSSNELHGYLNHCFRLAGNEFDAVFEQGSAELVYALSDGIVRIANNLVESALSSAMDAKQERVTTGLLKTVAATEYGLDVKEMPVAVDIKPEPVAEPIPEPPPMVEPAPEPEPEPEPAAEAEAESIVEPPAVVEPAAEPKPVAEAESIVEPPAVVEPAPEPEPVAKVEPIVELSPEPEVAHEPERVETVEQEVKLSPEPEPVSTAVPVEAQPVAEFDVDANDDEDAIPELIQDTLPNLAILAPALASPAEAEEKKQDIPAWERDPTLAELRPDLDALEHAMAVAQGLETESEEDAPAAAESANIPELVPEITLDKQIEAKIEEAAELLKQSEEEAEEPAAEKPAKPMPVMTPPLVHAPKPVADVAPEPPAVAAEPSAVEAQEPAQEPTKDNAELEEIAENIARAKTINDVDDKMAETLFGEEFSAIAAQIADRVAAESSANDELEFDNEESSAAVSNSDFENTAAVSGEPTPPTSVPVAGPEASASERLATVRALNGTSNAAPLVPPSAETIVMAESAMHEPTHSSEKPEPIEDQINTSITQTLKALNVRPPAGLVVENDAGAKNGGEKKSFFGRFRKS